MRITVLSNFLILANCFGFRSHNYLGGLLDNYILNINVTVYDKLLTNINGSTIQNVSTWADRVKMNQRFGWTRELHYIDIDDCGKIKDPEIYCEKGCIYKTLNYLSKNNYPNLTVFENWALLIHLLQDLFQPLHSFGLFRGGNDKTFRLKRRNCARCNRRVNFHQLFDSFLPEFFIEKQAFVNLKTPEKNITDIIQANVDFICDKIDWNTTEIFLEDYYSYIGGDVYYNILINDYLQFSNYIINKKLNLTFE